MKKILREAFNILLIVLGIFSTAMGVKGFLLSSRFIDGGVTGISMLVAEIFHLSRRRFSSASKTRCIRF